MVKKKSDDFLKAIVVEMTPRVRASHATWNIARLREIARAGYQVRVFGFLMFDGEHRELVYEEGKSKTNIRRGARSLLAEQWLMSKFVPTAHLVPLTATSTFGIAVKRCTKR